jgi:hypothetical protein
VTEAFNTIANALCAFGSQAATAAGRLPEQAAAHPILLFEAVALVSIAVISTGSQVR